MRLFLFLVLIIPGICVASGPESEAFIAVAKNGKAVEITYRSDPEPWSEQQWIYGSTKDANLRYCWTGPVPEHPTDYQFVCSSEKGVAPSLVFQAGHYNRAEKNGLRYKEAIKYFRKTHTKLEDLMEYFFCIKGCGSAIPIFIFNVAIADD